jgi:uncharacterized SAM-binding protein YcdF (DUF218 family)
MQFITSLLKLILFAALLWLAGFGYYFYTVQMMKPEFPGKSTDAIVVLTGSEGRVETGLALWANGQAKYLFISGVNKKVTENEIKALWKGKEILPKCCIALGQNSNSTIENSYETQEWMRRMNFKSLRLVTANYHMPRALLELRHAMPSRAIIAQPMDPKDVSMDTLYYWELAVSEYNKILVRWVYINLYPERTP